MSCPTICTEIMKQIWDGSLCRSHAWATWILVYTCISNDIAFHGILTSLLPVNLPPLPLNPSLLAWMNDIEVVLVIRYIKRKALPNSLVDALNLFNLVFNFFSDIIRDRGNLPGSLEGARDSASFVNSGGILSSKK